MYPFPNSVLCLGTSAWKFTHLFLIITKLNTATTTTTSPTTTTTNLIGKGKGKKMVLLSQLYRIVKHQKYHLSSHI